MAYFLSAFRQPDHPSGYWAADWIKFEDLEGAMSWIYTNMLKARDDLAMIRFDATADRRGIVEMFAEYQGEWGNQNFDQLNDIETVMIQRDDFVPKSTP